MLRIWLSGLWRSKAGYGVVAIALLIGLADGAIGQIVPDDTLGTEGSRVTPNVQIKGGAADRIDGGAVRGANLFHSFQEFNVGNGQRVYFANPADVRNILTRVTGTNLSNIQGTLGVEGGANLFLMNPNGIVFGQNARLDVAGSFVGTTANAIGFGNQGFFSATSPEAPSLLLTIEPSAFLFSQIQNGNISSSSVAASPLFSGVFGLQVPTGQTLTLLGGNVQIDGGGVGAGLHAFNGRVEIGAVAGTGIVERNVDGNLIFPADLVRADATFTNSALVDVAFTNGGNIGVTARNLDVLAGSSLLTGIGSEFGSVGSQAGDLILNATGSVTVRQSSVGNIIYRNAMGNGGNLFITAGKLHISDNAAVGVATLGSGNAGNLSLIIENLTVDNGGRIINSTFGAGNAGNSIIQALHSIYLRGASGNGSSISTGVQPGATGAGGRLMIQTERLSVVGGAQVLSATFGLGDAGDLTIRASDSINLDGIGGDNFTGLSTGVAPGASGHGGNLSIETRNLTVAHGGQIATSTRGDGDAGSLTVRASESIDLDGSESGNRFTGLFAEVDSGATGSGGNLFIETGRLLATNGGQISTSTSSRGHGGNLTIATTRLDLMNGSVVDSSTYSAGNGGNLIVHASDSVKLDGFGTNNPVTGLIAGVNRGATGNGGDLSIKTNNLNLTGENARINASTYGNGRAGSITIDASRIQMAGGQIYALTFGVGHGGDLKVHASDSIDLNGFGIQNLTGFFTGVAERATGDSGNLAIATTHLNMESGSQIYASTFGAGHGGNLIIRASESINLNGSRTQRLTGLFNRVESGATGFGGNLLIETGQLSAIDGAQISSSTYGAGDAGNLTIRASDSIKLSGTNANSSDLAGLLTQVEQGATGNGGNLAIETRNLTVTNGSLVSSSTLGTGNAGNVIIRASGAINLRDLGGLFTQASPGATGAGGDLTIQAREVFVSDGAGINLDTYGGGNAGDLTINARNVIVRGSQVTTSTDGAGNAGSMIIRASNLVDLSGELSNARNGTGSPGGLLAQVNTSTATGRGGNLTIDTRHLRVSDGSKVQVATFGQGNAGRLRIRADEIDVFDTPKPNLYSTGIFAGSGKDPIANQTTRPSGNSGRLYIDTHRLTIRGGEVVSDTRGSGQAGTARIRARDLIEVIDPPVASGRRALLGVNVNEEATGNAGDLIVDTARLVVRGGQVTASSSGRGQAGRLIIHTTDSVDLSGVSPRRITSSANGRIVLPEQRGGLSAQVDRNGTKPGGNLTIQTDRLTVRDRAQITVRNQGTDRAGDLSINARSLQLSDRGNITAETVSSRGGKIDLAIADSLQLLNRSQIAASTQSGQGGQLSLNSDRPPTHSVELSGNSQITTAASRANGTAGTLTLNTESLNVSNSNVTVSNPNGRAGNLGITANSILLDNGNLTAQTGRTQGTSGANIQLQELDLLLLRNGSQIDANASDRAKGGNITVDSQFIVAVPSEDSNIRANAVRGQGGNVQITTAGLFGIQRETAPIAGVSDITASSEQGVQGAVTINQPNVDPSRGLTELPTVPTDAAQQIAAACPTSAEEVDRLGSFIVSGRGGIPASPIDLLSEDNTLTEWVTPGGNPSNVKAAVPSPTSTQSIVEAQAWVVDAQGKVKLVAQATPQTLTSPAPCQQR